MFHQDSAMQWNKLRIWKKVTTSKFFVLNSLHKSHLNSVRTQYVCDKSENARVCAKWQWNALDWCYWIALPASPVVQSSNTVSCVSLSFHTHPCVIDIKYVFICSWAWISTARLNIMSRLVRYLLLFLEKSQFLSPHIHYTYYPSPGNGLVVSEINSLWRCFTAHGDLSKWVLMSL